MHGFLEQKDKLSARETFVLPSDFEGVKVRLRNAQGQYLATGASGWTFSADLTHAFVFDYVADKVEEYVRSVARVRGMVLKAMPVEPREFLETCDGCHQMVATFDVFFDGGGFYCPRCWRRTRRRRQS